MNVAKSYLLALLTAIPALSSKAQTHPLKDAAIQLYLLPEMADSTLRLVQPEPINRPIADSLFGYALSFTGKHYKRGGSNNKGFDCSGYTMIVFRHFNIKLPHTSSGQSLVGIDVKRKQLRKGDLVFFKGRNSRRKGIGHVGIVISESKEPVRFIHSSTSHGVRIDELDTDYYNRRFVKATRVLR